MMKCNAKSNIKKILIIVGLTLATATAFAKPVIISNNTGKTMVILPSQNGVADWSRWTGIPDGEAIKYDFNEDSDYTFGFDFDVNNGSIKGGVWTMTGSDLPDDYASFRLNKKQPILKGLLN